MEWTLIDYASKSHYDDHYTSNTNIYRKYINKSTVNLSQYKFLVVVLVLASTTPNNKIVEATIFAPVSYFNLNPSGTTTYIAQNHISEYYLVTFGHVSNLYYLDAGSTSSSYDTMETYLYGIK